ncbi:bifunctional GrpB family protein/GNAT family N-acetyltransferase [Aquicella lusitana]|uniref:GrpB-like predicted nucleotidyltransferase (UPF0157 family) n=1 Tax=Aquicella lusitana TaxID=254246 RepID=A0A370GJF8_9COXI|nr:bifunctional GrpB family protein/GNAT family N-acetyltransferase [Aquicella lusitana]RDI42534.1 GrpB-like predicted nucleotidyltransferase (UPF0157 family) [Aquicella lusitana]VVC74313.1 Dephospho-CoA kinase [Aquicella lusitana]
MQTRRVEILPYDPEWPALFKEEAKRIQTALGHHVTAIHHIGSTSIPEMPAKPVIDILIECESIDVVPVIERQLLTLNYEPLRRNIIPHVSFFTARQDGLMRYHLHLFEVGDPQIRRHIHFRDYVTHHPDAANAYAELKKKLAKAYRHDIYQYVAGKAQWVQEMDAKAKLWSERRKHFLPANRGPAAHSWSREKIVKAMEANLNVHMTHFAQYLNQVELIRVPNFTLVNAGLADDTFNYAIDAHFPSEEAEQKIEEVTAYFRQRRVPFSWWISPHDKPADLCSKLERAGYHNTENNVAMYFELDSWDIESLQVPELEIVRALDKQTLRDFALVLANDKTAFETYFAWVAEVVTEDDPIEYYVGYVEGKPVVRGLSCYYAGVAGLHWLSTVPDARRKGYGTVMQQFRLKRAKDLGYHIAVLQASDEGFPLYQRLGYKECGYFREFKIKTS